VSVETDWNPRSKRLPILTAYLALLALALPVPLLHHYYIDGVIESMRPALKLADGHWSPLLMPVPILFLRWLGQLSWGLPCALLALFIASFRVESLGRWESVGQVAIVQCASTTFYACYATFLLGSQWLACIHRAP